MAISRISDLPNLPDSKEIEYNVLAKALIEVSYPDTDINTNRYTSMSMRCEDLSAYIAESLDERDVYENTVYFHNGIVLSGHVSINEDVPLNEEYGLDAYGYANSINAATVNTVSAGTLVDIKSDNNIDITADDSINIVSEGDVTTQADGAVYIDAANTVIASSVKTIIAAGSPDNIQVQVD